MTPKKEKEKMTQTYVNSRGLTFVYLKQELKFESCEKLTLKEFYIYMV